MNYDFISTIKEKDDYYSNRLFTELNYALEVSEANGNKYASVIEKAIDEANSSFVKEGNITATAVKKFENALAIMKDDCKKYELLLVGHAHIDMNWMWSYDETVAITLSTFETMLRLMEEYPSFTFSQSQASVYEIVEKYDKDMLKRIKKRVKEGRWEITASQWVEGDKNLASGEDLSRHILETKRYLSSIFDIAPESLNLDFEPDTFGHNQNMPEILSNGGVKYMYHCRGSNPNDIYRWVAPSGASVLSFCEPEWYIEIIKKTSFLGYVKRMTRYGLNKYLRVYGVGDHGGGPTRRDLNYILDMQKWPIMPTLKFSSYKEWFSYIENSGVDFPIFKGELNKVFTGCYTSQSRIKKANAENGRILLETEKAMAMAKAYAGKKANDTALTTPWREHLFSQFHDILPGSGVPETREYAMGKSQELKAKCATEKTLALKSIAENLNTEQFITNEKLPLGKGYSSLAGQGRQMNNQILYGEMQTGDKRLFMLYNPATEGEFLAKIRLYDYEGNLDFLKITDGDGNELDFDCEKTRVHDFFHHYNDLFVKVNLPSMGYKLIVISADNKKPYALPIDTNPISETVTDFVLEDEYLKVVISERTGAITKIIDKKTSKSYQKDALCYFNFITERNSKGSTAWRQGSPVFNKPLLDGAVVSDDHRNGTYRNGKALKRFEYSVDFGLSSKIIVTITLECGVINYNAEVYFHEQDREHKTVPTLSFQMDTPFNKYLYDIPYSVIERVSEDRLDEPALSFVCGLDEFGNGLMLQAEGKNGFKGDDGGMSVSLIRNSIDPEDCPENTTHKINIKVAPVFYTTNEALIKQAERNRTPVSYLSVKPTKGTLPLSNSLISVEGGILTCFKPSGKAFVLRLADTDGAGKITVSVKGLTSVTLCDGVENEIHPLSYDDNGFTVQVKPYSVNTIKITL